MNNRQLPICIPTIATYHYIAFPLSVIESSANYKKEWLYSQYINCKRDNDDFNLYTYDPKFIDQKIIESENSYTFQLNLRQNRDQLKKQLVQFIDDGKYIHGILDEFYIPEKTNYNRIRGRDNFLIYGYENAGDSFLSIGYTKNEKFEKFKIPYDNLYESFLSMPEEIIELDLWRVNSNYNFKFDLHETYKGLCDYLDSKDSMCILRKNNIVFGSQCNKKYVEYLEELLSKAIPVKLKFCFSFVKHKMLMMNRIEYIADSVIPNLSNICNEYSDILKKVHQHYELCALYNRDHNINCLSDAIKIITEVFQKENEVLNKLKIIMHLHMYPYIGKTINGTSKIQIETNPILQSYQNLAFPLALLQGKISEMNNWLMNHYININYTDVFNFVQFPPIFLESSVMHYKNEYIYLSTISNNPHIVIERICEAIYNGWCITGTFDEYYISSKLSYKKQHFLHDYMIYGYDLINGDLNLIGYTQNHKLEAYTVNFEDYIQSLGSIKNEKQSINLYKIRDLFEWKIDFNLLKSDLLDYLNSTNSRVYYSRCNEIYGLNAQEKYIEYFEKSKQEQSKIDLRFTRLFYEHKMLMHQRFKYLSDNNFINTSNITSTYKRCMMKMLSVHNLALKYNYSANAEHIETIVQLIKECNTIEQSELSQFIPQLI